MTSNDSPQTAVAAVVDDQVPVLLVEDDDGDALLVGELLRDVGASVAVRRARSLAEARDLVPGVACVLLDLGLPDSQGLDGLRQLLAVEPEVAVVMLTGQASEHLGEQAVRAGAQDYLVKGQVAGRTLNRVIRYAVERRRADQSQRAPRVAQVQAQENARLERGLLPQPLLTDPRLGGDFYDVVVLAGRPPGENLSALNELLEHERHDDTMFATLCMVSVEPDRRTGWVRMAGHLPPLLLSQGRVTELPIGPAAPLGLSEAHDWPGTPVRLDGSWSLRLYTDGLIEGRIGEGSERLGTEGLIGLIGDVLDGDLHDDLAVLVLSLPGGEP
jgi:FixJ family two-component response regulator